MAYKSGKQFYVLCSGIAGGIARHGKPKVAGQPKVRTDVALLILAVLGVIVGLGAMAWFTKGMPDLLP